METVNPSSRVNPNCEMGYPARRVDQGKKVFRVNVQRRLTEKGLPVAVIQPGLATNPGSCKESLRPRLYDLGYPRQPPPPPELT